MKMKIIGALCFCTIFLSACEKKSESADIAELKAKIAALEKEKTTAISNPIVKPTSTPASETATVKGQVFIVTKGGTNYKLGLVEVGLCDLEQAKKHFGTYYDKMAEKLKERTKEFDELYSTFAPDIQQYLELETIYNKEQEELMTRLRKAKNALQNLSILNSNSYNNPDVEFTEERSDKYETLAHDDPETHYAKFAAAAKEYQEAYEKAYNVVGVYALTRDKLVEKTRSARSMPENQQFIIKGQMESVLRDLPLITSAKTDADGCFVLKVKTGTPYILVASAKRQAGDSIERYYWVEPLNISTGTEETKIMFSNDNLRDRLDLDFSPQSLDALLIDSKKKFPFTLYFAPTELAGNQQWVPPAKPQFKFFDSNHKALNQNQKRLLLSPKWDVIDENDRRKWIPRDQTIWAQVHDWKGTFGKEARPPTDQLLPFLLQCERIAVAAKLQAALQSEIQLEIETPQGQLWKKRQ